MSWREGQVWEPPVECVEGEPGSWTFTFESPKGKLTTGTPVKIKAQEWKAAQKLTEAGNWIVNVTTTAPYEGSESQSIPVKSRWDTT